MSGEKRGRGQPKKDGRRTHMLLLHDTIARLDAEAARLGIPRSEVVDRLAAEHLNSK